MPFDLASIVFYIAAIVLVGSALAVVVARNIVHAALFLVVVFGDAAAIYVLLNAEFIAIVQILIYAGAVTILILFAIMLTANSGTSGSNPFSRQWILAGLIAVLLGAGVIYAVSNSKMEIGSANIGLPIASGQADGSVVRLGQLLYSPFEYSYVLPFEVASIVLLVAIVGAIMIGRGQNDLARGEQDI